MLITFIVLLSTASVGDPTPAAVREAVEKALPRLVEGATGYAQQRDCFSCHHQAVPVVALDLARERGFAVDEEMIEEQVEHTAADLEGARESYRQGKGQPGGVTRAGYALWTFEAGGRKPDDLTATIADYLLQRDQKHDHWRTSAQRPPTEASQFTTTFVAIRALQAFATPAQQERAAARIDDAREWLLRTPAQDTEDRVFRLWGLKRTQACDDEVGFAADDLRATQRDDGGWSQLDDRPSDAYATGTALVALHLAGGLATDDPAYRKGLAFLLRSQGPDGTWHVVSRSKPFQTYFESGFPHGKDQFISSAASGWATAALVLACPKP